MQIQIKVITKAKKELVKSQPDGSYKVWVRAVPEKGRANKRVIELFADSFGKSKSQIRIVKGLNCSSKLILIG